jgi:outer membrane lipoprotein-sorting protein
MRNKRIMAILALCLAIGSLRFGARVGVDGRAGGFAAAQDIVTAEQFFAAVGDRYAQINDYTGRITISTGKTTMTGDLSYKAPTKLRIDFTQPPDQVIAYDGQVLTVYIPEYRAILTQSASDKAVSGAGPASAALASREGLRIMKRNYTMAFEMSPTPVALEGGAPGEQAVRLVLSRSSVAEGFRTIKLSIDPETTFIRRIEGWSLSNERLVFDFTNIKINQGVPDARFVYDSPASANLYNNFLFKSGE